MNGRERILAFLGNEPVDHIPFMPITMMFAADQLGVPYREYVTDHRVLVESQIRTADRFGIDYVSVISDPTREAFDSGARIDFFDDQPPAVDEAQALLREKSLLDGLRAPDPHGAGRMRDRLQGLREFRRRVGDRMLIEGWVEGPCAEAADLRGINSVMLDFYDDPDFARRLIHFVTEMEIEFARAQVEAGADLVGIGDAASSLVGPLIYEEFIWPAQERMVEAIHEAGALVRLHICGDTRPILSRMGALGCEIVDLDYFSTLEAGRRAMGDRQVLLGNLHPVQLLLNGAPEPIREALAECWKGAGPRYIVGAGCEVPRGTPAVNLEVMAEFARMHR